MVKQEWTREKLIKAYIEFFKKNGHKQIENASLIPKNDPTVLFTTAGMHPLVPYLLGQPHTLGKRLVNVQKCIRTGDIDSVGDTTHHTFFEMLGNWSLGDYWKEEAIRLTYKFYTEVLKIPKSHLAVTIFGGDDSRGVGTDNESRKIWNSLGVSDDRIMELKDDNWWGPAGATGPCGPSTEIFYWKQKNKSPPKKLDHKDFNDGNWVEIGNDVLMEFLKDKNGKIVPAKQKNIDFGGGVERTIAALNGLEDNYLADMWKPIIEEIESLSEKKYDSHKKEMRIISDHLKAVAFIINDGITPSNTEQGYVVRRLIRRAIWQGKKLGVESFTQKIAKVIFKTYQDYKFDKEKILLELEKEEEKFNKTLDSGIRLIENLCKSKEISGKDAFLLYQSHGIPVEMINEIASEKLSHVNMDDYKKEYAKHQELSRTATEGKFKSGLADHSVETTRLHTATHLFLAAVNKLLEKPAGKKEILQRGSNITAERARFDFTYDRKLTEEEVKEIEELINSWITTGSKVERKEMNLEEARKMGAMGIFEEKYKKSDVLSVYIIGEGKISKELCTGPHVNTLKEMQGYKLKIFSQESVGSGVRRVKIRLEKE
ncbi:MAG: alanine--tRNA ligase [Nanoarchaeota archaeon]